MEELVTVGRIAFDPGTPTAGNSESPTGNDGVMQLEACDLTAAAASAALPLLRHAFVNNAKFAF
jgi:hypothetical protein